MSTRDRITPAQAARLLNMTDQGVKHWIKTNPGLGVRDEAGNWLLDRAVLLAILDARIHPLVEARKALATPYAVAA